MIHAPLNRANLLGWICRLIGHSFWEVDMLIFKIKTNALNRDMTATIRCRCCGETFVHKDAP